MKGNVFTTKMLDLILIDRNLFIVLEYVNTDLKKVLGSCSDGSFTEEHVVTIMYNSLCALNFLHSANIMHRDLKPANILIDLECQVKLCDFGLSRTVPNDQLILPSDFQ